jgi:hypothetical protein
MPVSQQQPFGRRGRVEKPAGSRVAMPAPTAELAPNISPDVIAAVMGGPSSVRTMAQASMAAVTRVAWSFRAAVLAGLIVGLFNAAARATTFVSFGSLGAFDKLPLGALGSSQISLGQANVPLTVLIAMAGLWSGARASALALLFAQKALARLGQTSLFAYSVGGAAASLAYSIIAALLWADATPLSIALDALSGLGAGFFYRLFAPTVRG